METAIIAHLQTFLVELGCGFCFEARQKRITFDNEHYFIDLVFYHRILKRLVWVNSVKWFREKKRLRAVLAPGSLIFRRRTA